MSDIEIPFTSSAVDFISPDETTRPSSRHTKTQQYPANEADEATTSIANENKTNWEKYLTLKDAFVNMEIPYDFSASNNEKALREEIEKYKTFLNDINPAHLQEIIENHADLYFFSHASAETKQCIEQMNTAVSLAGQLIDNINTIIETDDNKARDKNMRMIYIGAAIMLTGLTIGLTVWVLPYALPAMFVAGTKSAMLLDCLGRALSTAFTVSGILLTTYHAAKNYHNEVNIKQYHKLGQSLTQFNHLFNEIRSINMIEFCESFNNTMARLNNNVTDVNIHMSKVENSINSRLEKITQATCELKKETAKSQEKIDRLEQIISNLNVIEQRQNPVQQPTTSFPTVLPLIDSPSPQQYAHGKD